MKFARTGVALVALVIVACSGSKNGSGFGQNGDGSGDGNGNGNGNGSGGLGGGGDGGAGDGPCIPSPSNYEVPGDNCDNDGDGTIDNVPACDTGLSATGAAGDFVKAMGICQMADATHWGLVSATYTNGYGDTGAPGDGQHAIAPGFGTNVKPQEGASLGVISTGYATNYDDPSNAAGTDPSTVKNPKPGSYGMFKNNSAAIGNGTDVPSGYPKAATGCPTPDEGGGFLEGDGPTNDVVDVSLKIQVPANAKGISFDFDFYSGEWPDYVCSPFNDSFIAYLSSTGFNGGKPDNITFDSKNNPVSVNNGFFDRCTAGADVGCAPGAKYQGVSVCGGGTSELQGTGFLDFMGDYGSCKGGVSSTSSGGATGWLTTQAPVTPGETITIDFMIWNTGDQAYDSSVLLDHLTWVPGAVVAGTARPR